MDATFDWVSTSKVCENPIVVAIIHTISSPKGSKSGWLYVRRIYSLRGCHLLYRRRNTQCGLEVWWVVDPNFRYVSILREVEEEFRYPVENWCHNMWKNRKRMHAPPHKQQIQLYDREGACTEIYIGSYYQMYPVPLNIPWILYWLLHLLPPTVLVYYRFPWIHVKLRIHIFETQTQKRENSVKPVTTTSIFSVYALVLNLITRLGPTDDSMWLWPIALEFSNWPTSYLPLYVYVYIRLCPPLESPN